MFFLVFLLLELRFFSGVNTRSPVIVVPGSIGNRIEAKLNNKPKTPAWYCYKTTKNWFTLWLNLPSFLPLNANCWMDNIRLEWNMDNMTVTNSPGVETRIPGFGSTETMETLDPTNMVVYLRPLMNFLRSLGYRNDIDLRGAPYDFRYSPDQQPHSYYVKLRNLIEETYEKNNQSRVTIFSHSFGCSVTHYFLTMQSKEWKKKHIKQWIPVGAVFGGTIEQAFVYLSGYTHHMHIPSVVADRRMIREKERTLTSNLFMMPHLSAWPKDHVIVHAKNRSYTVSDMDELLNDWGFSQGSKMRRHILNTTYMMSQPPDVPIHCIYGLTEDSTVETMYFDPDSYDYPSDMINGLGDGAVNAESLRMCARFRDIQSEPVTLTEFFGVRHINILFNKRLYNKVKTLL